LAAFIDGREVKLFELDVSGHERVKIALHQDLKKLLSYINEQSEHCYKDKCVSKTAVLGLFIAGICPL
jgi:hypothetical protein